MCDTRVLTVVTEMNRADAIALGAGQPLLRPGPARRYGALEHEHQAAAAIRRVRRGRIALGNEPG
jgi:hypothetical protein